MGSASVGTDYRGSPVWSWLGYLAAMLFLAMIAAMFISSRPASAATVSAQPDPGTVQVNNGRVEDILVVGNKIYLAGSFTQVTSPDGAVVSRSRLAAINATTGALLPWNPRADRKVFTLAASPDGGKIYAGGEFTRVGGKPRSHLAAVDASTGRLDPNWTPNANDVVLTVMASENRVYLGGFFTSVNGQQRLHLAQVDGTTGALNQSWNPRAVQDEATNDGWVHDLVLHSDGRLYAAGRFQTVNGKVKKNLVALDPVTGAPSAWSPDPCYPIDDIELSGERVYVAGGGTPQTCNAGGWGEAFSTDTGDSLWKYSSDGDFQAVTLLNGTVYFGGHFLEIPHSSPSSEPFKKFVAVDAATGALDRTWRPSVNGVGSVWAMTTDGTRVYAAGDFTRINGQPSLRLAQFS